MSREMLGGRRHILAMYALDVCLSKFSRDLRIAAEGTQTDDRVVRIIVDIRNRSEVRVDTDRAQLAADDLAGHDRILRIASSAQRHIARQSGAAGQPVDDTAFLVSADHQRDAVFTKRLIHGRPLQAIGQLDIDRCVRVKVCREQDHTADIICADDVIDLIIDPRDRGNARAIPHGPAASERASAFARSFLPGSSG